LVIVMKPSAEQYARWAAEEAEEKAINQAKRTAEENQRIERQYQQRAPNQAHRKLEASVNELVHDIARGGGKLAENTDRQFNQQSQLMNQGLVILENQIDRLRREHTEQARELLELRRHVVDLEGQLKMREINAERKLAKLETSFADFAVRLAELKAADFRPKTQRELQSDAMWERMMTDMERRA
jgi:hypothetical protein